MKEKNPIEEPTTITLSTSLRDWLKNHARKDETYDDFIRRMSHEAGYADSLYKVKK